MNKKLLLIFLSFALGLPLFSQTPTWQWVKGGGSTSSPFSSGLDEDCRWLGTDQSGNVYGMSMIFNSNIQIDTTYMNYGFGYDDFAVFSYRCDGSFRWARYFGGGVNDVAKGMYTDKDGNTYVGGYVSPFMNEATHYGDSTIPAGIPENEPKVFVKIDSTGHTVWIRFVPSTISLGTGFYDLQEDDAGNITILTATNNTGTWGPYSFTGKGIYIVRLDKNDGNIIGLTKLELSGRTHGPLFSLDEDNSCYITWAMGYQDTVIVGNDTLIPENDSIMIDALAKFDSTGNLNWYQYVKGNWQAKQGKIMNGRPTLKGNNVYLVGHAQNNVDFFGMVVNNPNIWNDWVMSPLVCSFRKDNGHFIRLKHLFPYKKTEFDALTATPAGIALGGWAGLGPMIYNQSDTLKPMSPLNTAYPFIIEIDTALTHFSWALATRVNNASSRIQSMITDIDGNIYAGGFYSDSLYPSSGAGIRSHGGPNDFFVAKISGNPYCGCILAVPQPQFLELVGYTVSVSGSATGQLDSLYWDWGDGTFTQYLNQNTIITHTYSTTGTYNLCLKAYNYCGIKDSCLSITGVGINEPQALPLHIYPNPVSSELFIENPGLMKVKATLYSIPGEKIFSFRSSDLLIQMNMNTFPAGAYLLELRLSDGRRVMKKIFKE